MAGCYSNPNKTVAGTYLSFPPILAFESHLAFATCQGGGILREHDNSLRRALENAFPELHLRRELYQIIYHLSFLHPCLIVIIFLFIFFVYEIAKQRQRGYWQDIENRRKFFTAFAKEMGFDPSDTERWEKISRTQFVSLKVP